MANIKSAKKRIKVIQTKTRRNKMIKSALKTDIKRFLASVNDKNLEAANTNHKICVRALDMASLKGVIHKNKAARTKSKLSAKLNALNA